jgi:nucleotide-binding universal stress UspA family protein
MNALYSFQLGGATFKHLLVATDGSKLSTKALTHALSLARGFRGKLTAYDTSAECGAYLFGSLDVCPDETQRVRGAAQELACPRDFSSMAHRTGCGLSD